MKLRKILLAFIVVLGTLLTLNITQVSASNADTLVIHYYRYDESYDDWFLWLWHDGIEVDAEHHFNGTDTYGVTATIDIAGEYGVINEIGILIRDDNWNKDYETDRFIDLTEPDSNGVVHAYFLQAEGFFSYTETDKAGCDPNSRDPYLCAQSLNTGLLDAYFGDDLKVNFTVGETITSSDITILKDGSQVGFSGFTSGKLGVLTLDEAVDVSLSYMIQVDVNGDISELPIRVGSSYESQIFNLAYNFDGWLGTDYSSAETTFRVWAPVSSSAEVNLYEAGHTTASRADGVDSPSQVLEMTYIGQGVFELTVTGDLHGTYYTFNVVNSGQKVSDIQDPYGKTFGLNGQRSMVIDMEQVNPVGWDDDEGINGYTNPNDAIIYELHVRDLTSQQSWGGPDEYRNTYMGLTVTGTSYTNALTGVSVTTGLDHLIELGITHLHLLPTYDQDWNDEANFQFNWGYNPQNYNSPEGGYSTDPYDGAVRVNEYKQMVMALHENGINVINDVVYNHTGPGAQYSFNKIVPNYFYRFNSDGSWSNGSGVGNETASERYMVRKFIVDSIEHWATEYHIDGFRFDLMSIHDYTTMNELSNVAEAIDPDIFVYGEPWGGGTIALPYNQQAGKHNLWQMPLISAFNDNFRNAIKGSPDGEDGGYVTTGNGIYDIMSGIEGSGDWNIGSYSYQSINYVTAHDNLTLYDKLLRANNVSAYTQEVDYQARLSNSIVMFSQGVPFLHAGVDFLRTKGGNHNSYDASDAVNKLDWVRKSNNVESFEYYKGIIEIRKAYASFKMSDRNTIAANLEFLFPDGYGLVGYRLTRFDEDILIYHNSGAFANDISLPSGAWSLISDRDEAGLDSLGTYATRYPIEEAETLVFVKGDSADVIPSPQHKPEITSFLSVVYEGRDFKISANAVIAAYSVDDGDFINVDTNEMFIYISDLLVGEHDIRIKDINGGISDPFTVKILANPSDTDPTIELSSDEEITVTIGDDIVFPTCTATDVEDGEIECLTKDTLPTSDVAGTYQVIYYAKDSDNNESDIISVKITVEESEVVDPDPNDCVGDDCVFNKTTGCFSGIDNIGSVIAIMIGITGFGVLFLKRR